MKMKKNYLAVICAAAMLLCGCGADKQSAAPIGDASSQAESSAAELVSSADSSFPDTAPDTLPPREMKDRITSGGAAISDYTVIAGVSVWERGTDIRSDYEGLVTDEGLLSAVWEMLNAVEDTPPGTALSIGGRVNTAFIRLVPKAGGEPVTVSVNIGYYNEGEEGGPEIVVLSGRSTVDGDTYYVEAGDVKGGIYSSSWLRDFCETAAVKEENLTGRTEPEQSSSVRKGSIVLARRQSNYAWSVEDRITVIDIEGRAYSVELAGEKAGSEYSPLDTEHLLPELEAKIKEGKLELTAEVDPALVKEIAEKAWQIDPSARVETEPLQGADMGQVTVYVVTDRVIRLSTSGDVNEHLDDPTAQEILDDYTELLKGAKRNEKMP